MIVFCKQINHYDKRSVRFFFQMQNKPYTKDLVLQQQKIYNSFFYNSKILALVAIFRPPGFGHKIVGYNFEFGTLKMF